MRNGILPIELPDERVKALAGLIEQDPDRHRISIDLERCVVMGPDTLEDGFDIAPSDREMLMEGLDAIAVTMKRDDEILAFQARDRLKRPWVYLSRPGSSHG